MAIRLTREELIEIVAGRSTPSAAGKLIFEGVEFDSRQIKGGELFLALKGDNTHGHDFLESALERGAALALVEDVRLLESHPEPERLIVVEDSLKAFWKLANYWRRSLDIPVIGVTGSVGKTTVKEMTACLLLKHSKGMYSRKSYNNHVGVPYSICGISREHSWAVLEMGMNHTGEMAELAAIAEPDIAAIVNIQPVHIEYFKDLKAVADAKFEILQGLKAGAPLILKQGDVELEAGVKRHDAGGRYIVRTFGVEGGADCYSDSFKTRGFEGIEFTLHLDDESIPVQMKVLGEHNSQNAAAAALLARAAFPDISADTIAAGLESYSAPLMRLNVKPLDENRILIDDCYNAGPTSMRAALEMLIDLKTADHRVGLLLGDMRELGETSRELHLQIGELAAGLDPVFLIAVGDFGEELTQAAKAAGIPTFAVDSPVSAAHTALKLDFNVLLVKASRGVQLDKAVQVIMETAKPVPPRQ